MGKLDLQVGRYSGSGEVGAGFLDFPKVWVSCLGLEKLGGVGKAMMMMMIMMPWAKDGKARTRQTRWTDRQTDRTGQGGEVDTASVWCKVPTR